MLCRYSYLDRRFKVYGEFQCDTDDFKAFWRKCQSLVCMCYVKLENYEYWVYADGFGWVDGNPQIVRYSEFHDEIGMEDYLGNFSLF